MDTAEFARIWTSSGSPAEAARKLDMTPLQALERVVGIHQEDDVVLPSLAVGTRTFASVWKAFAAAYSGVTTADLRQLLNLDERRFRRLRRRAIEAGLLRRRKLDTIQAPLTQFDLNGFVDGYRSWAGDNADASVSVMRRHGDVPEPLYEDRDLVEELVGRGWLLFFPMHEPLVADTTRCIDGVERDVNDFDIGSADQYGWLVEVREGQVQLHPALYDGGSGPTPSLDLQGRCGVLDECMAAFARRFLKNG